MTNPFANIRSGGGSTSVNIWRGELDANNDPVYNDTPYDAYSMVPKGEYRLKITGLQELYEEEIQTQYRKKLADGTIDPDGPTHQTKTGLELEIVDGPHIEQRVFIGFVPVSLYDGSRGGNKANLYFVFTAAYPDGGSDLGVMLGQTISGYLKPSDNGKRMVLVYDTCSPAEVVAEAPESNPFKKTA